LAGRRDYTLLFATGASLCLITLGLTLYLLLTRKTVEVSFSTNHEFATEVAVIQSQISDTRTQIDMLMAISGSITTVLVAVNIGGLWLANRSYERDKEAIQTVLRAELTQSIEQESAQRIKAAAEQASRLESELVSKSDHITTISAISNEVNAQRDLLAETRAHLRSSVEIIQRMQTQFTQERSTTQAELNIARAQISNVEGSWPLSFSYLASALESLAKAKEEGAKLIRLQIYLFANLVFIEHLDELSINDTAKRLVVQFAESASRFDRSEQTPIQRLLFFAERWKNEFEESPS